MANREELLKEVRAAAGRDPRVDLKDIRIDIADDGTVTLTGEVPDVAAKRCALKGAASLKEVPGGGPVDGQAPAQEPDAGLVPHGPARLAPRLTSTATEDVAPR